MLARWSRFARMPNSLCPHSSNRWLVEAAEATMAAVPASELRVTTARTMLIQWNKAVSKTNKSQIIICWGRQPNKKNPTKIQQIQQNVGFFVGFFEDPNTQQRPSMLGFFVGFLLGFSEELFDSCWIFVGFLAHLLDICWDQICV